MTQPSQIKSTGAPIEHAKAAVVLLHGRWATAESMFGLADIFEQPEIAYWAPQAPNGSWYPASFLAPLERNEPQLSAALTIVDDAINELEHRGFRRERVALLGFSQGGCLALEYAARNASRYGALIGLSAGLIGPEGTPRDYAGSLDDTPVFLGCSNVDTHIPLERIRESTRVLSALGGKVTERIYRGMGHEINDDEIDRVRRILAGLVAAAG